MTRTILGWVKVGNKPVALAVSTDGSQKVYVANRNSSDIAVVDVSVPTSPVLLTPPIPTGKEPEGIALLPDGTKLYVTSSETNRVWVFQVLVNSPYLTPLSTIDAGEKPSGIAVTRDGSFADKDLIYKDFVYVSNSGEDTVSVIDASSDQEIATIPVGKGPKGLAARIIPTAP